MDAEERQLYLEQQQQNEQQQLLSRLEKLKRQAARRGQLEGDGGAKRKAVDVSVDDGTRAGGSGPSDANVEAATAASFGDVSDSTADNSPPVIKLKKKRKKQETESEGEDDDDESFLDWRAKAF